MKTRWLSMQRIDGVLVPLNTARFIAGPVDGRGWGGLCIDLSTVKVETVRVVR